MLDFLPGAAQAAAVLDGVSGTVVGWGDSIGVEREKQRWVPSDDGRYQIGFWAHRVVTPEDLQKPEQFNGFFATLADDNAWAVPAASMLPTSLTRDKSKHWVRVRKPQFEQFWRESEVWFRRFLKFDLDPGKMRQDSGLSEQDFLDAWVKFVVFVLRQNYRITEQIASELGILDSKALSTVTFYAVDGMAVSELDKEQDEVAMTEKKIDESSPSE